VLVPFRDNTNYTRTEPTEPPWWVKNSGEPSKLYLNSVYQNQEAGTNDLGLIDVWLENIVGAKMGVVDMTGHGWRVRWIASYISGSSPLYSHELSRCYPDSMAAGILDCVTNGCRVICLAGGSATSTSAFGNACYTALQSNVVICCAVPNTEGNLDGALVDYPYCYRLPNILGVSSTDRNGNHYSPSATGSNVVAAPGRNVVAMENGVWNYSSGTSWACPMVTGCMALLVGRYPNQTAQAYIAAAKQSARNARISPLGLLSCPAPTLTITKEWVTVAGPVGWVYWVQWSPDLKDWQDYTVCKGGERVVAFNGYFRARVQ
jgi:subtilisin family serine protease